MLVQIREARDFLDVVIGNAIPAPRALPLAFPVLRIDERPLALEHGAVVDQTVPLDHPEVLAGRDALIDPVLVEVREVPGVDDERVPFPSSDRLAVERADD